MAGKIIYYHGLPGSGKSTERERYIKEHPEEDVVVVNRDDIRTQLFGEDYHNHSPVRECEQRVTVVQEKMLKDALEAGKTVIDDNTNLHPGRLHASMQRDRAMGATIEQVHFDVPVEECQRRNKARGDAGGRFVPPGVIESMASRAYDKSGHLKRYIPSKHGVAVVSEHTPSAEALREYNKNLAKRNPMEGKAVVLLDIDGTLANNSHQAHHFLDSRTKKNRDFPGFYGAIATAPVNEGVRNLANAMRENDDVNIVVLTGRDNSQAHELIGFLQRSKVKVSRVIMKEKGDMRPDNEFKQEALDNLQKEGYIPVHSIDDREGSVKMYQERGIMVSTVDIPDWSGGSHPDEPAAPEPAVNTVYGSGKCMRCGSKLRNGGNLGKRCATKMNL